MGPLCQMWFFDMHRSFTLSGQGLHSLIYKIRTALDNPLLIGDPLRACISGFQAYVCRWLWNIKNKTKQQHTKPPQRLACDVPWTPCADSLGATTLPFIVSDTISEPLRSLKPHYSVTPDALWQPGWPVVREDSCQSYGSTSAREWTWEWTWEW